MAEISESDYREDIDYVLKNHQDPSNMSAIKDEGKQCLTKIAELKTDLAAETDDSKKVMLQVELDHYDDLRKSAAKSTVCRANKRRVDLDKDKRVAATKLCNRCETRAQEKLREHQNWDKMECDPVLLCPAIRELCTNYQESRYAYSGYLAMLKSYFAFQHESTEWAKTVISMRNVKPTRLPIVDVAVRDVGNQRKKFKLEIGQV